MNKLFIDCETEGLNPYKDKLVHIGVAWNDGPVQVLEFPEDYQELREKLLNPAVLKVMHNANFDLLFLNRNGYKTVEPYFCTQVYYHLQNPNGSSKLKDLGEKLLGMEVKRLDDIIQNKEQKGLIKIGCGNTKGYGYVEPEILKSYLRQDVEITRNLYRLIEEKGVADYYAKIEQPLIGPILEMELKGIKINHDKLEIFDEELTREIRKIESYFQSININPRSPKQVREFIKNEV